MLRVYHSNRLDVLEEIMEFIVERQPLADPFAAEVVLVQSTGMAQWLQMTLAQRFGIAANIDFPLPASFIWDMFVRVLPGIPKESAFNKAGMGWKLMTLLPEKLAQPEFELLRHYLEQDDDGRKLFQLASRIADLYDQYLVYRPEWLTQWENDQLVDGLDEAQRWQAPLWRALVEYTAALGQPEWHRANLYQRFISALESGGAPPPGLPQRVFICGVSALPPVYLRALQALGNYVDVHLLFTNPCRYYWGDIRDPAFLARLLSRQRRKHNQDQTLPLFKDSDQASALFDDNGIQDVGNPLLASWGKLGRDYSFLLSELEQSQEVDVFVDIPRDNMLHGLQADILDLQDSMRPGLTEAEFLHSTGKYRLDPGDRSVTFHACHSPQREVEILHDRLLAMMDEDATLTPRDIIVMVADIDSYSPFIQAVFGSATGNRWLPFALSDRRASQAHPALQAFLSLLTLPESRFTAEQVLALLEVPALASRFAIDEEGLRNLRQWVSESGIRWGMDDDNVREFELPATGQHTWRFGLTRMLLGYAMESRSGEWQEILPYDESSGLIAGLVGQLADLLMQLNTWRKRLTEPRPLDAWQPLCREMLEAFFQPDAEAESALALAEQQWQALIRQGMEAGYRQPVPLTLLRDELSRLLDKERISQRFLAGPVNFCTLMPMRSIPFRVVCLLGMNDGVYPRTLSPLGFDLMNSKPVRGDRSRRDDDRYLFLEAIISAQERLYVSYIGRSVQDNSERFPSVLVQELLDYLAQSYYLPGDEQENCDTSASRVQQHLVELHTRTPFDARNFRAEDHQQSYAREWLAAACEQGESQPGFIQPLPPLEQDELSLEQLQRFWAHPIRAFFQMRLGVSFRLEETELPEDEPFSLDSLERYQINQALLNTLIDGEDPQPLFRRYRAAGALPYGVWGELGWDDQLLEMEQLAASVQQEKSATHSMEVDLEVSGIRLTGWLQQVQRDGLLRWRPSVLNVAHGMQLWLEHLVYCACGGQGTSRLLGRKESRWCFPALPAEEAQAFLAQWVDGYREGMCQPLVLLPASGGAWVEACYDAQSDTILWDDDTQRKARSRLLQRWEGNQMVEGEGADIWRQRLWRTLEPDYYEAIIHNAQRYLVPLFRYNSMQE
ncbi:exodeoxyribonuclease V subunit gamma [Shimwellia blattae]|uniref:RecBCD enzyme subunit RecC n=1 Tax=Shimwellia blattae (strain ATCC 29907 / DSM 4481 / JCM 1650 / NBRC 105725 / CDC 9005-74) TaxID=630626 RepID=I2B5X7_SHIBC|nr:exodeoxyribonuclease V subunit gamma [Shimwellia blattae]AFJ45931.1 exodeoxyribonuclease V gamma chain [Shimwellia blattae DSM 4481 = NBRC 105725]GAB81688.1 exodeoxyribonuclease V gamma chain [Shimwellia blattae DSM 4481 = NBRC 105725]VDY63407.1 Exodeoxyribonuclease V gamma chain [Shimwellia blattae]VEC21272.1 Exodeoxyribonuclease V gamma chain [Shimwellia blattae]